MRHIGPDGTGEHVFIGLSAATHMIGASVARGTKAATSAVRASEPSLLHVPRKKDIKKEAHLQTLLERAVHCGEIRVDPSTAGQVSKVGDN